jgi:hypothetical protein
MSDELCCYDCCWWIGRCLQGRQNVFARSKACNQINYRGEKV